MKKEEWQYGEDSKQPALQRAELNQLWLENLHKELEDMILLKEFKPILTEEELEKLRK